MSPDDPKPKDLEDARLLYTFAKSQAAYGDMKLAALALQAAAAAAGPDYAEIAESCGWTRKELFDICLDHGD